MCTRVMGIAHIKHCNGDKGNFKREGSSGNFLKRGGGGVQPLPRGNLY